MKFALFVALRYLFSRRKQTFISLISAVSVLGITIGVASLVVALALISGFHGEIQGKVLEATSAIMASLPEGGIKDWRSVCHRMEELPFVKRAYPQAIYQALARGPLSTQAVMLRGISLASPPPWARGFKGRGLLLGMRVMESLGVFPGETVEVYLPKLELTPFGARPRARRVKVEGGFSSGLYVLDNTAAAFPLSKAKEMFGQDLPVNYINIEVDDIYRAGEYALVLQERFPDFTFTPWSEINRTLFESLKLEKKVIFMVIALIVVVAALNIVASLVLLVMEKVKDIGILMSMGATRKDISMIFMFQGLFVGFLGVGIGEALGILFSFLANRFSLIKIPPDIYQLDHVPFHVKPLEALGVGAFALFISFLSTIYPSKRASSIDPSEAIRYE